MTVFREIISMSVIDVKNVSICYVTGDFKNIGLKEFFMRKMTGNYKVKKFWADRDITFSLEKGDMLGILGSNGAGKSTLLKAVTGIMVPTEGYVETHGKIAALLELSSGFDEDLTVRENTYLRGAMLGYTRQFMNDKYPEIIDFAELESFQDRPFKQLSSGMKSRLAFSIACLVNPDILILDEVLAVGDGAFRKKSGKKMKEILGSGVTGILVSHATEQVRELCNKVLWLDHGNQIAFSDEVGLYCDAYSEFLETKSDPPSSKAEAELLASSYRERLLGRKKNGIRDGNIHFSDVSDPGSYYYEPVYWAVKAGITSGSGGIGRFSPDAPCTREQIITFLWRLKGSPWPNEFASFPDVVSDSWYEAAVSWASENGITSGFLEDNGRFGVGRPCSREEFITFLWRAAGSPEPSSILPFSDVPDEAYYKDAVSWAAENNIVSVKKNVSARFGVGEVCTRAMVVTFLYRFNNRH